MQAPAIGEVSFIFWFTYIELVLEHGWLGYIYTHTHTQSYHQGTPKQYPAPKWGSHSSTNSHKPATQAAIHCSCICFSLDNWLYQEACKICDIVIKSSQDYIFVAMLRKRNWKTVMAFPDDEYQRWSWQQRCFSQLLGNSPCSESVSMVKKCSLTLNMILGISIKMMHMYLKIKPKYFSLPKLEGLGILFLWEAQVSLLFEAGSWHDLGKSFMSEMLFTAFWNGKGIILWKEEQE